MGNKINNLYTFGDYTLNARESNLWRRDELISLPPKVFLTLAMLVDRHGQTLSKEEIMSEIWPDSFVEESNLSQNIYTLRQMFGKENNYIVTVPKIGYRFSGPVITLDEAEYISSLNGGSGVPKIPADDRESAKDKELGRSSRRQITLIKRSAAFAVLGLVFLALLLAAGKIFRPSAESVVNDPSDFEIRSLTDNKTSFSPAISPDGSLVAYLRRENGKTGLRLMDTGSGSDVAVTINGSNQPGKFVFSADGKELYFRSRGLARSSRPIYRVSYFGGDPKLLLDNVWGNFGISSDGGKLAFFRANSDTNSDELLIYDRESDQERILVSLAAPEIFFMVTAPAWSPDGKKIAFLRREVKAKRSDISIVDVETGSVEVMSTELQKIFDLAWLSNSSLLVTSKEPDKGRQIWQITYPEARSVRITNDLDLYEGLAISGDRKHVVSETSGIDSNIFLVNGSELETSRPLTEGSYGQSAFINMRFADDDTLIYDSRIALNNELWTAKLSEDLKSKLTENSGTDNTHISPSPDGKTIYFSSSADNSKSIWQMNVDGTGKERLTTADGETHWFPTVSSDGNFIYYFARRAGGNEIRKRSLLDKSESVVYTARDFFPLHFFEASPDGRFLAFSYKADETDAGDNEQNAADGTSFAFLHLDGSNKIESFKVPSSRPFIRFTNGGSSFDYVSKGKIFRRNSNDPAGKESIVFETPNEDIFNFDWTSDHKALAVAKGRSTGDLVLLQLK